MTREKGSRLGKKIETLVKQENGLYERAGIVRRYVLAFEGKKRVPLLGRIGAWLTEKMGGSIQVQYIATKRKK